jgi:tripartite-type tricarboxylate transporter receptor subunit TctC
MMHRRHLLGATAGLLAAPAVASAQAAWPSRGPVRLVAQFPPGGLVDTVTRLVAPVLSANIFLMTHASVMVYSAATLPTLPFDPINDFTHLGLLVEAPSVLIVRADSPLRSFQDFLAAARTRPTRYGSSGIGSAPHMLGAMLAGSANLTQLDHAPYAGSAPAMRDLLGGHIETMIDPITTNVAAMQNGTLRALAISSAQRLPAFPDVPTFVELGFPSLVQAQWVGVSGPRGLPQPIAERMMQEIPKLVAAPAVLQRMTELQTLPRNPVPLGADFVRIIETELATAREVARRYNIQAGT